MTRVATRAPASKRANDEPRPELFTGEDVASFCHVDLKTIHAWANKGLIFHRRTAGRHLRFRRADVVAFLRAHDLPLPAVLRLGRPAVFAVADHPAGLAAARAALVRRFELTTFDDPFDALVEMGREEPDSLVVDAALDAVDPLFLVSRVARLEATRHVRVVVFASDPGKREPAIASGAADFVLRSEPAKLSLSLERLLGLSD